MLPLGKPSQDVARHGPKLIPSCGEMKKLGGGRAPRWGEEASHALGAPDFSVSIDLRLSGELPVQSFHVGFLTNDCLG